MLLLFVDLVGTHGMHAPCCLFSRLSASTACMHAVKNEIKTAGVLLLRCHAVCCASSCRQGPRPRKKKRNLYPQQPARTARQSLSKHTYSTVFGTDSWSLLPHAVCSPSQLLYYLGCLLACFLFNALSRCSLLRRLLASLSVSPPACHPPARHSAWSRFLRSSQVIFGIISFYFLFFKLPSLAVSCLGSQQRGLVQDREWAIWAHCGTDATYSY